MGGPEARELYGFLALSFADVDTDKDGFINAPQFNRLCEKVAALPRRFGMAPSWQAEYGNDVNKRDAARKVMFDEIDAKHGPGRNKIGLHQWVDWATSHIMDKVP